jgi:ABC-type methionine transport system permease subunit
MSYFCLILAALCAVALIVKIPTGTIDANQLAGAMGLLIVLGCLLPDTLPSPPNR